MKKKMISGAGIAVSIVVMLGVGCGGGGGGGESSERASTVDSASIDTVVSRITQVGICQKRTYAVASSMATSTSSVVSSGGVSSSAGGSGSIFPAEHREYEYSTTYYGSLGGEMTRLFQHANGTTTYTYTMNGFKNRSMGKSVTVDGKYERIDHGKPGEYGPVVSHVTKETKGVVDAKVEDGGGRAAAKHYAFELKGYNRVFSKTIGTHDTLDVTNVLLKDKDTDEVMQLQGIKADIYGYAQGGQIGLVNLRGTYDDSDVGTFKISSERVLIDDFSSMGGLSSPGGLRGDIHIEATDGTKGVVKVNGTSVKIYTDDGNGNLTLVSELDCNDPTVR